MLESIFILEFLGFRPAPLGTKPLQDLRLSIREHAQHQGFEGESGLRLGLVAMGGQLEVLSGCTLVSLFFEQNIYGLIHAWGGCSQESRRWVAWVDVWHLLFPTCQVRVSRFYQSCLLLLVLLLLRHGPQPVPDLSGYCQTSTASASSQWALPG